MTPAFLQSVIDAIPDAVLVIGLDYRIHLANRTARMSAGIHGDLPENIRCYEASHRRGVPCDDEASGEPCPLRNVVATKAPCRVYHTHYDSQGREVSVAIDAAPIFDEGGDVAMIVESCRDITARTLSRHILEIGNRHMEIKPLLEEFVIELKHRTGCAVVGISLPDADGRVAFPPDYCPSRKSHDRKAPVGADNCPCLCTQLVNGREQSLLPQCTKNGSIYIDCVADFLGSLAGDEKNKRTCCPRGCESFAVIPVSLDGRLHGLIHLGDFRPDMISAKTVESLESLVMELGTAIQRVRSDEALRAARDELETRVEQRTEELTVANAALREEIAERTRLEREVLQVVAKEQERIATELHDGVGQTLTGLGYLARSLHRRLRAKSLAEAETAAELERDIPRALSEIRKIVNGLIPIEIGTEDLAPALASFVTNVTAQTAVACRFEGNGSARISNADCAIQLYRVAQEAVTNAVKHAGARDVVVSLNADSDQIRLEVRDDGTGIPPNADEAAGCGLRTMRYRTRAIGGTFEVRRLPEGGTLVASIVPQEAARPSRVKGSKP
jgi:signal transduction histidine kinase